MLEWKAKLLNIEKTVKHSASVLDPTQVIIDSTGAAHPKFSPLENEKSVPIGSYMAIVAVELVGATSCVGAYAGGIVLSIEKDIAARKIQSFRESISISGVSGTNISIVKLHDLSSVQCIMLKAKASLWQNLVLDDKFVKALYPYDKFWTNNLLKKLSITATDNGELRICIGYDDTLFIKNRMLH